jgi:hypothetical protein
LFLYFIKHHVFKKYGTVEVKLHACLTLTSNGDEWRASSSDCFTLDTSRIEGKVVPRAGVNDAEREKYLLQGIES